MTISQYYSQVLADFGQFNIDVVYDLQSKLLKSCYQKKYSFLNTNFINEILKVGIVDSQLAQMTIQKLLDSFLGRESISAADLDLIVCTRGPGSFTGLRIAMATAKGLSLGSSTPMVSIQTLDMLAYGLEYFNGVVVPIIDARKKRFYTAIYQGSKKQSDNLDLSPEDINISIASEEGLIFPILKSDFQGKKVPLSYIGTPSLIKVNITG